MNKIKTLIALALVIISSATLGASQEIDVKKLQNRIENRFNTRDYQYILIRTDEKLIIKWAPAPRETIVEIEKSRRAAIEMPVADAGDDINACLNADVVLNSAGSFDPMGQGLSRKWSWTTRPPGSDSELNGVNTEKCQFKPDLPGDYVVELVVWTADDRTGTDTVNITVADCDFAPRAVIDGPGQICGPMPATIHLDGSNSFTQQGYIISYNWQIISSPDKSIQEQINGDKIDYIVNTPGRYDFSLTVESSLKMTSEPVYYSIKVSDGEPPEINGKGKRNTVGSLLIKRDFVQISMTIKYLSDCKKDPAKYIFTRRAINETEFGPITEIIKESITVNTTTGISYFAVNDGDLLPTVKYIYLIAGLSAQGDVLTFKEVLL
jgi:hypothetical protein